VAGNESSGNGREETNGSIAIQMIRIQTQAMHLDMNTITYTVSSVWGKYDKIK
jgi:hypothetical protein